MAIGDGVITSLDQEAEALAGPGVERVELTGRTLVPAFRDGHVHPVWGARMLAGAPVRGSRSVEEVAERVAKFGAATPSAEWITGIGYDPALLAAGRGDAVDLDRATTERPVFLWASDLHTAWVNSEALRRAGFGLATHDPAGGVIIRRGDGSPSGALLEAAADEVWRLVPEPSLDVRTNDLRRALLRLRSVGIAWAQEASAGPGDAAAYLEADTLPVAVNLGLRAEPGSWRDQRDLFRETRANAVARRTHLCANTVKIFVDGVVETGTAAMLEPYSDDPSSRGSLVWEPRELREAAAAFDADGFQVHLHAIGDAGVRTALHVVRHVIDSNGPRDRRPVLAHLQVVDSHDLARFAELGVTACFQPLWAQQDHLMLELTEPRLGPERASLQYPIGELWRRGTRISFGSDWPVTSPDPLKGIAVAVTRQTKGGLPPEGWLPHHRLTLDQAVAAATGNVAFQAFDERRAGRIAAGQRADLCVLDTDLTTVAPARIAQAHVERMWLSGVELDPTEAA